MAQVLSFSCTQKFFDTRHFPRGFRRSGAFTINEADLLERYGQALQALASGTRPPQTDEEQHFVDFVQGRTEGHTPMERLWAKYLLASRGKKLITISGSPRPSQGRGDEAEPEESATPEDVLDD
ncbi:DUF413 domain-containing protein [Ferrimonas balearica]|uniref:DUF413 domain-containing protein n=1 Tax=Ferrimonas balearica TaxID=44012 RepID=UPI001C9A1537|nr:DUF413 domain-containing protein [Ferrimonas balearica]MBY5992977.1 DUF413 domain-containing protein [Ferrimonas balearica]